MITHQELPPLELPPLRPEFQKMRTRTLKPQSEATLGLRLHLANNPEKAWSTGQLWYKLDGNGLRAYKKIRKAIKQPFGRFILNWARRTGKTFLLLLITLEDAIRTKGGRFNVAAATKESLTQFIWPLFKKITSDCPDELMPWYSESQGRIEFDKHHGKDAAVVQLAGCNDSKAVERLRGPYSHGNMIEEMGSMPETPGLRYVLVSILNPQLKDTEGWTLGAMTPPKSPGHAAASICLEAEAQGPDVFDYCTTFDCPRYDDNNHAAQIRSDAKLVRMTEEDYIASPDFRREWLALIEVDPTFAVLPTWTPEKKKQLVRELDAEPIHIDRYTSMDIGFSPDWTAILYAYWSFQRQKLYIVGERLIRRMGTSELVAAIEEDEERFHGYVASNPEKKIVGKGQAPFMRVADNNNPILLKDLACDHGLIFCETAKDHKRAAIVDVCEFISDGIIEISPECTHLIAQMTAAIFDKKGKEFERSEEFGHFDLVDALVYLVRNVIPNINRVPRNWGVMKSDNHINNEDHPEHDVMMDVLGMARN